MFGCELLGLLKRAWSASNSGLSKTIYVHKYICIYRGAVAGLRMVTEFCYFGEVALWTNSDFELLAEPVSPKDLVRRMDLLAQNFDAMDQASPR